MIAFFYDSWVTVLKFLIPGAFLGIIYDIIRLFRISRNDPTNSVRQAIFERYFSKRKKSRIHISDTLIVFFEDVLFFLIVALTEIIANFHFNDGEIRIYCLLISMVGFALYQKTIGRLVIFSFKKILYPIRKLIYLIACMILTPIFFLFNHLLKPIARIKRKKNVIKPSGKDV